MLLYIHVLLFGSFGAVYLGVCWKFQMHYLYLQKSLSLGLVQLKSLPEKPGFPLRAISLDECFHLCF